jgi:TolB-like protein/class 3 adenylate cyclase/Tfp pilus assembly protein PilF
MTEKQVQRRLAAIFAADVVGYSRLMGRDDERTLANLTSHHSEMILPCISEHRGRIVKTTGDGLLAEFASIVDAVRCAIAFQDGMQQRNADLPEDQRIMFRIGINIGDVIVQDGDVFGDGVNIAARLESIARPGGVCVTGDVYRQLRGKVSVAFEDLGSRVFKNIDEPVSVFGILQHDQTSPDPQQSPEHSPSIPDKPSIAVLSFENMSGDPEQEYFADGIAEDIITSFSRIHWLFVIARNSSFTYKGQAVDVKRVSRELGVRYVLEGSVRKAGSRVRISVQLIDAVVGVHLWAERYDRDLTDIFEIQDEITQSVTASIEPQLLEAEASRSLARTSPNLDAWDFVMRARSQYWRMTQEDSDGAIALLQKTVEGFPEYGPAHGLLAFALLFSRQVGWTVPDRAREVAARSASRAMTLDHLDPWAHVALGYLHVMERRTDEAVAALSTAIELNPNFAAAFGWRGFALAFAGRSEQAIPDLNRAIRLSPRDPQNAVFTPVIGVAHFFAGDYERALEWTSKAVQIRPDLIGAQRIHCATLGQLGQIDEAKSVFRRILTLQPEISEDLLKRIVPYARPEDMERYIDGLRRAGLPR